MEVTKSNLNHKFKLCVHLVIKGMKFRVEKCAVLTMKKGKMGNSDGISLRNKTTMK